MAKIKDIRTIAEKWSTVTPGRSGEYRKGVTDPVKDWAEEALAAEERYVRGVTEAATGGRYGRGVSHAGTSKWQEGAKTKGPGRFAEGVALGRSAYERGFSPYRDEIEHTDLPSRGPKGDPSNIQRVAVLAAALHNRKLKE